MQRLIGHWRKTTIVFGSPKDEHLVLHGDGTAENWVVTAESRSEPVIGPLERGRQDADAVVR